MSQVTVEIHFPVCVCVLSSVESRQKEKKMAKTRSKVKSSDEDGSPKSAQKKVKLLQP